MATTEAYTAEAGPGASGARRSVVLPLWALLLVTCALLAALAWPATAGAAVDRGTIVINRGVLVNGSIDVRLGLTRPQVVALLGKPVYENANGYMQYAATNSPVLFDLYLRAGRVEQIGVSGARFCLRGGAPCLLKRNGALALRRRLGTNLQRVDEQSGTSYVVSGLYKGRRAWTSFGLSTGIYRPAAQILMVFIGRR